MIAFERIKSILGEMASPSPDHRNQIYYHGTNLESAGQFVIRNREIRPPEREAKEYRRQLTPVKGHVYITPELSEAMIYAMGGILWGSSHSLKSDETNPYGYVFMVQGRNLVDIYPDEDYVGKTVAEALDKQLPYRRAIQEYERSLREYERKLDVRKRVPKDHPVHSWPLTPPVRPKEPELSDLERKALSCYTAYTTPAQRVKFESGERYWELAYQARLGKILVKKMRPEVHLMFIQPGVALAHKGPVKVSEGWRFQKGDRQNIRGPQDLFRFGERIL